MDITQLRKGDRIYGFGFPSAQSGGNPGMVNLNIVDTSFFVRRITKTRPAFWKKKITTTLDDHIDFRWLPFVDGKINYCSTQGLDVLSGFFSGCWMARYVEGDARVCHITCQRDLDLRDCKQVWRDKKLVGITEVTEFRPDKAIRKGANVLGVITRTGDFYAIGLNAIAQLSISNPWRTPQQWQQAMNGLNDIQAQKLADQDEVPFGYIYTTGVPYLVVDIKGPLPFKTFPPP